jgi:hypothetical protein
LVGPQFCALLVTSNQRPPEILSRVREEVATRNAMSMRGAQKALRALRMNVRDAIEGVRGVCVVFGCWATWPPNCEYWERGVNLL